MVPKPFPAVTAPLVRPGGRVRSDHEKKPASLPRLRPHAGLTSKLTMPLRPLVSVTYYFDPISRGSGNNLVYGRQPGHAVFSVAAML